MNVPYNVSMESILDAIRAALTDAGHATELIKFNFDQQVGNAGPWRILHIRARFGKWDYDCLVKCHPMTTAMGQWNGEPVSLDFDDDSAVPPDPAELNAMRLRDVFVDDDFANIIVDHATRYFIGCVTCGDFKPFFPARFVVTQGEIDAPMDVHFFANDEGPGARL